MTINIEDIKPGEMVEYRDFGPMKVVAILDGVALLEGTGNHRMIARLSECIAKPKVELPTEPNAVVYSEKAWAVARRAGDGSPKWFADSGSRKNGSLTDAELIEWADDWVRLAPESESRAKIAGEVIDWFWENTDIAFSDRAHAREHFGVDR